MKDGRTIYTAEFAELTLARLGLDPQFADAIATVLEAFDDEELVSHDKGKRKAKITIDIELERILETRATTVRAGLKCEVPKYLAVKQSLRHSRGAKELLVEVDPERQLDLVRNAPHIPPKPNGDSQ